MAESEFRAANAPPSDLFWGMTPQDVDSILEAARPQRVAAKSVITNAGDDSEYLYLLWRGRARFFYETFSGKKLISIWVTPGHMIGGAALSRRPYPYVLSSEAVQDSVLLVWDTASIRTLGKGFPRFLENLIRYATDYIAWYVAAYAALASETAQERLANLLVTLGPVVGEKVPDGIEVDVTNEELAASVVITPFTTSRIMSEWQKIGAISKRRGKVVIHSPERLFVDLPALRSVGTASA
jgi:CRP-like cAMP-binding protein